MAKDPSKEQFGRWIGSRRDRKYWEARQREIDADRPPRKESKFAEVADTVLAEIYRAWYRAAKEGDRQEFSRLRKLYRATLEAAEADARPPVESGTEGLRRAMWRSKAEALDKIMRERRARALELLKKAVKARQEAVPEWQDQIREDVKRRILKGASDSAIGLAFEDQVKKHPATIRAFAAKVRKEVFPRKK